MREYIVNTGYSISIAGPGPSTVVGIAPTSVGTIEVIRAWCSQFSSTSSAQQRIAIGSKASTYGSFSASTPVATKSGDPSSAITTTTTVMVQGGCGINASSEGTGTLTLQYPDNFNVLNGWLWVPTPNETFMYSGAKSVAAYLTLLANPGTTTGWNAGLVYRELF